MWRKLFCSGFETCFGPSTQGAGIRYQNTSRIQIVRHFEEEGAPCNLGLTPHLQVPAILLTPCPYDPITCRYPLSMLAEMKAKLPLWQPTAVAWNGLGQYQSSVDTKLSSAPVRWVGTESGLPNADNIWSTASEKADYSGTVHHTLPHLLYITRCIPPPAVAPGAVHHTLHTPTCCCTWRSTSHVT